MGCIARSGKQPSMPQPGTLAAHWNELRTAASALIGFDLSKEQLNQFASYTRLLLDWNQRMNLTGITEPAEIAVKHFLDSLTLIRIIPQFDGLRLIDIGTGAGFPGLVLAITFPRSYWTLLDSTGKKLRFIEHVVEALRLHNVRTLHTRAEDAGRDKRQREAFDVVVARAVSRMPALMEYTLPLCKPGGQVIAMQGTSAYEETAAAAKAIDTLGGELFAIEEVRLPTLDNPRYLVVIDKVDPTPKQYPRQAGTPERQPLA